MKKLFFILLAGLYINASSAQSRNDHYDKDYAYQGHQQNDQWNNNDRHDQKDFGYSNSNDRNNNYGYQKQHDHFNRQYDRRDDRYQKDYRVGQYEHGRQGSFGTGLVVGGAAAILLGVLIAH